MLNKVIHNLNWQFTIVCMFSLLVSLYCQHQVIFNRYAFNEDLRQEIYWMEKTRDPQLFKGDLIADFKAFFASPLLKSLYRIIFFLDVEMLAKLLSVPLCLISAIYMSKLGNKIAGIYCGLFSGVIFVLAAWYKSNFEFFGIGDSGDFFPPLIVIFLYYFFVNNMVSMALILILQTFIYPPAFLISIGCFTVYSFYKVNFKKAFVFILVIFTSGYVLFNNYRRVQMRDFGDTYSIQEIRTMNEFKEGGRLPLIYNGILEQIFNNRSGIGKLSGRLGILSILAFTCALFYIKRIKYLFQGKIALFFMSSLTFFILANIFMLRLFEPSRYLLVSLPLILIITISICLSGLLDLSPLKKSRALFSILIIIFLTSIFSKEVKPDYMVIKNINLFNFLESLPKDSLIVGHPYLLDDIPIMAKKKVFLSSEASYPYFKKCYAEIQKRTYDFFNAYYSTSFNSAINFCHKNNIDYLIVRKYDFSKIFLEKKAFYYEPFNNFISKLVEGRNEFALTNIPHDMIVYEDRDYIVMRI